MDRTSRTSAWAGLFGLALVASVSSACGEVAPPSSSSEPGDASAEASCAPIHCPASSSWSNPECRCISADSAPPQTPAINASDYDQSCVSAKDCVAIVNGELQCGCGPCPNAAINVHDLAREEADAVARQPQCPVGGIACGACQAPCVLCTAGKCAVEESTNGVCVDDDAGAASDASAD